MADQGGSISLKETSGVQFSLSFLIQILGTVILAVWGYSQLDARIKESKDKPIPSDWVQNTTLASHERELVELRSALQILEQRLYDHKMETDND